MKLVFFTNFINHHQVPLADELYKILDDNYKLVSFEPIPNSFINRGYHDYSDKPYHIKGYLAENREYVMKLALESDILLQGAAPEIYVTERMKKNLPTIRYEERLFKKVDRRFLKISFWLNLYKTHTIYRCKPLYMLGASAYNRFDTSVLFAYPNKVFKWAYFIKIPQLDINKIIASKPVGRIDILWCGNISHYKRPDLVPYLAHKLRRKGINFKITMIGTGGLEEKIRKQIIELGVENNVEMIGNIPNDEVLSKMQSSHMFIFTSDYGEGWGAVLSEAMANGCAAVSSNRAGATKFLIKHGYSGMIFKSGSVNDLYHKVMQFINNEDLRNKCIVNAYTTMQTTWSPQTAAINIVKLCDGILEKKNLRNIITIGPCSIANLIV